MSRGRRIIDHLMRDFMYIIMGILSLGTIIYGMITRRL
jgi:hypothetical protein